MLHHLLYVAHPEQIKKTEYALNRLGAVNEGGNEIYAATYQLKHPQLGSHILKIHVLDHIEAIPACLRTSPFDLLIYDERHQELDAVEAVKIIHRDMQIFGEHWGPDFTFPMSRTVVILKPLQNNASRCFELGRYHVRNYYESPDSTIKFINWLKDLLTHSVMLQQDKVGMALAGGGIEGYLYQIGCIHALEMAFEKEGVHDCEAYSGISSGSICAFMLANKVPAKEIIRALARKSEVLPNLTSSTLYHFAGKEIFFRLLKEAVRYAGLSPSAWASKLFRLIPTGFFRPDGIRQFLEKSLEVYGGKNNFSELSSQLFIGATDHDTFEAVVFGEGDLKHVPITEAVIASCALPPFFIPNVIDGRYYIDGQITRTSNMQKVVDAGCRLLIVIDPFKPMKTLVPGTVDKNGGIYTLVQMVKTLVYTRFTQTINQVTERYPDVDFIVFQPDDECAELMSGSPMRYTIRTRIIDLAFRSTLSRLRERYHVYSQKFAKYGMELKPVAALNAIANDYDVFS